MVSTKISSPVQTRSDMSQHRNHFTCANEKRYELAPKSKARGSRIAEAQKCKTMWRFGTTASASKRLERLNDAKKLYSELINDYPETSYLEEAQKKINEIDKEITIFAGTN